MVICLLLDVTTQPPSATAPPTHPPTCQGSIPVPGPKVTTLYPMFFRLYLETLDRDLTKISHTFQVRIDIHFSVSLTDTREGHHTKKARNFLIQGLRRERGKTATTNRCEWYRISHCRSVHMSGPSFPSSLLRLSLHGGHGVV